MATRISGLLLFVATSFVFSATSFAQYSDFGGVNRKMHNFSFAPEVSSYTYKEPGVMKLSGTMVGFTAEYLNSGGVGRIKQLIPIQLRARFNYMQGNDIEYDGRLMDSGTPFKRGGEHHFYYDMVFAGGIEAKVNEKFSISPYLGLGYRYFVDKDDGETRVKVPGQAQPVIVADYKREQTYYYLPMGADWTFLPALGWRIVLNTELNVLLRGENTSHVSKFYGKDLNFQQKSGYGLKLASKFEKDFRKVGVFAEPFYRYWDIKRSDIQYINDGGTRTGFVEPKNNTHEFGARIGVSF